MAIAMPVYQEIVEFIAGGTTPSSVAAYRPSEAAKARVEELIRLEKSDGLSAEETAELEHSMQLEHLMRLAKARAHNQLKYNYK